MISPIAAGPLGLTSLGADSSLLLKRLVQSLRQLSERVRRLTQVLILFLQFLDFVLTFLQRVVQGVMCLHGLLSRRRPPCKTRSRLSRGGGPLARDFLAHRIPGMGRPLPEYRRTDGLSSVAAGDWELELET